MSAQAPGGVILETMVAEAVYSDFNLTYTPWDICSPLPAPLPYVPVPGSSASSK